MIDNEVNELMSLLNKDKIIDTNAMCEIFQKMCPGQQLPKKPNEPVTKEMIVGLYNQGIAEANVEERLFYIFYHLDSGKKGYLSPEDIKQLFSYFGQEVSLNDVQNSFRYAKLSSNRMSFEDFKQYFHKF